MNQFSLTIHIEKKFRIFKNIPFLPILIDEQIKVLTLLFYPKVYNNMMRYMDYVKSHNAISTKYHKYGGIQFNIANREIGHMHGDGLVDIYLNKGLQKMFVEQGIVEEHHVLKGTGWVSFKISRNPNLKDLKKVTEIAIELRKGL